MRAAAFAAWTDATGIRHFRMLPVPHGSEESRAAHAALALELASSPVEKVGDETTANELCDAPHPR